MDKISLIAASLLLGSVCLSFGADTLAWNQTLADNRTIVSSGGRFELGFFKPGNSSNSYLGIWFKDVSIQTVVWVANRDTPIAVNVSAELKLVGGNLVLDLVPPSKTSIWSTNLRPATTFSNVVAVLQDDGNFVLRNGSQTNSSPLWQSFDYPTHVFLPDNKLGYDWRANKSKILTSWKNSEDPASGRFSFELDPFGKQFIARNGKSEPYWTSGRWNGEIFTNLPGMRVNMFVNFSYVENENESYFTYHVFTPMIISGFVMDINGQIKQSAWIENTKSWYWFGIEPSETCHVYALCGPFGICNRNSSRVCDCPSGFDPSSLRDWNVNDYSGGCARKARLSCGINGTYSTKNEAQKIGFLTSYMDVSDDKLNSYLVKDANFDPFGSRKCRAACLEDCACNACSFSGNRCWIWRDDILNLQLEGNSTMKMIYVKVNLSDLPHIRISSRKYLAGIVAGCIGLVLLLSCSIGLIYYKRVIRRDGVDRKQQNSGIDFCRIPAHNSIMEDQGKMCEDDNRGIDVPFFEFKSILVATNNFSNANKLGQGGFGPVYKGNLPGGEEIAVKRLSRCSGQGEKEFKNELTLIAKLQHRNLVRLLGYSMQEQEMTLVYEYMPNKSLNCFIFDRTLCVLLDWTKRFDIILGIARGLLYLHQDSRLRIIHRDFKTSNILLDKEMNPKVSDFGLAKIIEGRDQTEANTSKVVGTYGYMSPEYALDGFFSIKSDVFSFGVVVLEIISGKRNTTFIQHEEEALSLLGYAWNMWAEEKPLELLDEALVQSCNSTDEVLKCIMIGLLCVQEDPDDRPTMSNVLVMLGASDIASLPKPQKPAFVSRKHFSTSHTSSYKSPSNVMSSITEVEGR